MYDPNIHSDCLLLRYLYANKFDIQSSLDVYNNIKTSNWHKQVIYYFNLVIWI